MAATHVPRTTTFTAPAAVTEGTQTGTKPTITGTPVVDSELRAVPHAMTGASITYQWQVAGTDITGATDPTYTVRPSDVGESITVTTTATLTGYNPQPLISAATAEVTRATFTQLDVAITGTTKVGHTLTADVDHAPTGTLTYQWNANGDPIGGADDATLLVTPDLAEADVTVTVTAARNGYDPLAETSDAVAIAKGLQAGTKPTITGNAQVNATLTATPGDTHAPGTLVSYQWNADSAPIAGATTQTLLITPDLAGTELTVSATHTLTGYDNLVLTSAATERVALAIATTIQPGHENLVLTTQATTKVTQGTFSGVTANITGTTQVGQKLTATSTSNPAATATYVWTRGDDVIGTEAAYTLTDADKGHRITLTATLARDGYTDAATTATTTVVVTQKAPGLTLNSSATAPREGQQVTLTWTTQEADTVHSTWADGPLATSGTLTLTPQVGRHTYRVTATNHNGTTTATLTLDVALPAKKVTVKARAKVRGTKNFTVEVTGLAPTERFTLKHGRTRLNGTATTRGTATLKVTAPAKTKSTRTTVTVTGSLKDRTGAAPVTVLPNKLVATTAYRAVRASDRQILTIGHLAPREKVTITYLGKKIATGRATALGTYSTQFEAGTAWGTQTAKVKAHRTDRVARVKFNVGRRCDDGVSSCP